MKTAAALLIAAFSFVVLPGLAFLAAHRWTAFFFRQREIPLPFDSFALAAGAGAASWVLAAAFWIGHKIHQRRRAP